MGRAKLNQIAKWFNAIETIRSAYWINPRRTAIVVAMTNNTNDSLAAPLDA